MFVDVEKYRLVLTIKMGRRPGRGAVRKILRLKAPFYPEGPHQPAVNCESASLLRRAAPAGQLQDRARALQRRQPPC